MEKIKTSLKYFLLAIALIVLYQGLLPAIYFQLFRPLVISSNIWISNITMIGYYLLFAILLMILFHKSLKVEWKNFLKNPKKYTKQGINAWIKGLILMVISNLIVLSITGGSMAGNETQNREILSAMPIYAMTTMCILGPFIEEMLFRKSFRKAFQKKQTFAIVTSLIFASLHVINGFDELTLTCIMQNWTQLLYFLPYSSLAYFFALAYYETDNIFTSTIAHTIHNTITVLIILIMGL